MSPVAPSSLLEFQKTFSKRLTSDLHSSIYHLQYWQRLFLLLQEKYPTLHRLFGTLDFNQTIARPYFIDNQPNHWSLFLLGASLPQWIKENYFAADKILIQQAASVDAAMARPRRFSLPPRDLTKPIYLQSHLSLLILNADLFLFRQTLLAQDAAYWMQNDFPPIVFGEERFFVLDEEISKTQYILLRSFQNGATLQEACKQIEEADDIATWFQTWASRRWFTSESRRKKYILNSFNTNNLS